MRLAARSAVVSALAFAALATASAPASAATYEVDDDGVQCPHAPFSSIQAAVDASGPGDTVLVCNGTYSGGVVIAGAQHAGLRLRGKAIGRATITGYGGASPDDNGVLLEAGATNVEISRLAFRALSGGPSFPMSIRINFGASASRIRNNSIDAGEGSAIQLFQADARDISLNWIFNYAGGITFGGGADVKVISRNRFETTNAFHAINVNASGNFPLLLRITGNRISGGSRGMYIEDAFDDEIVVNSNIIEGTATGIQLNDATGILVKRNRVTDGGVGIQVDGSAFGNVLDHNNALRNSVFDCVDGFINPETVEPNNTWIANNGRTSDPPGLCTPRR